MHFVVSASDFPAVRYVWKVLRVLEEDNLWLIKKIADDKKFDVDAILPVTVSKDAK